MVGLLVLEVFQTLRDDFQNHPILKTNKKISNKIYITQFYIKLGSDLTQTSNRTMRLI